MHFFNSSKTSLPPPPPFEEVESHPHNDQDLKRTNSTRASSSESECEAPPAYQDVVGTHAASSSAASPTTLAATSQLNVHAIGYDTNQALYGATLENISVYRVGSNELEYVSLRLKRSSNSCALVRGADASRTPLISTIYRWGPGRHPRMRILPTDTSLSVEQAIESETVDCELVDVKSRSMFSRDQRMETSFGTFEWRYGARSERHENYDAASLLICERTDPAPKGTSKTGKRGVVVAQLIRNDEFRTPGTSRCMGGNGGRLMMDLSMWADSKKASVRDVEAFVVAGCLCMLKREADRFRDNTIAAVV